MTRPLLYLCVRPQAEAAAAEYRSFLRGSHLTKTELHQHDLVSSPLPEDVTDRYAGFVVGGSPFNISDPEKSKSETQLRIEQELTGLTEAAIAEHTWLLLTCYGIGVATRLLGGTISTAYPEIPSASEVQTTEAAAYDPLTFALPQSFHALAAHKEGADQVPGATLLATNEACPVQMFRVGTQLYATQFHPEPSTRDFVERMTIYRDAGYFNPHEYDELAHAIESATVTEPASLLQRFAALSRTTSESLLVAELLTK